MDPEQDPPAAEAALVPVREEIVTLDGDRIFGAQLADGEILVPLRPIADNLHLSWSGQLERTRRDEVLAEALRFVRVTRTNSPGGRPEVLALPLKLLPGWLFGIDTRRIADPGRRQRVLEYRRRCFNVLWATFQPEIVATPAPPSNLTGAALAYELATAVQALAADHMALEARVDALGGKQETMAKYLRGWISQTNTRLAALELHLDAGGTITEAQALEIAGAVKAVAQRLDERGTPNAYPTVWGDFYRRYRVQAYRNLPAARYDDALAWLHGWYTELAGSTGDA